MLLLRLWTGKCEEAIPPPQGPLVTDVSKLFRLLVEDRDETCLKWAATVAWL